MFYPDAMFWQNHKDAKTYSIFFQFYQSLFSFCQLSSFIWCFHINFRLSLAFYWQTANFQNKEYIITKDQTRLANNCRTHWAIEVSTFTKCNSAFSMFFTRLTVINFRWKHLLGENCLSWPMESQERRS